MEQRTEDNLVEVKPKKSGRGQYERKARGSYKPDKKITVKLFQNKRLKPFIYEDGIKYYGLYIQVTLKSQTTYFPVSENGGMFCDYPEKHEDIDFDTYDSLDLKKGFILSLIDILKPFDRNDFKISEVALICSSLYKPLYSVLNGCLLRFPDENSNEEYEKEFDNFRDESQKFYLLISDLEKDEYAFSKIDKEFWCLQEYCNLIDKKRIIQEHYSATKFSYYHDTDLTLLGYLKGDFHKHLINEIGNEKAENIFSSIDFVLETYFCSQIKEIKERLNFIW